MGSLSGWDEIVYRECLVQRKPSGNVSVSTERVLGGYFLWFIVPSSRGISLGSVSSQCWCGRKRKEKASCSRWTSIFQAQGHPLWKSWRGLRLSCLPWTLVFPSFLSVDPVFPRSLKRKLGVTLHISSSLASSTRHLLKDQPLHAS